MMDRFENSTPMAHASNFYIDFFDKSIGKYNAIKDLAKKNKY